MKTLDQSLFNKLVEGRTFFDGLGKSYEPAAEVDVKPEQIAGVSCYWFTPVQPASDKLIIYVHGGGFAWGSIHSHQAMVSYVAKHSGVRVLFIEYALAPEYPYPHGVQDLVKVYLETLQRESETELFLIGDSAGGGLVVSALKNLQLQGVRQPNGVVLISPWLNLNADTPSYKNNASIDPILNLQGMHEYSAAYNPSHLPEASPSSLKFNQFPPLLIMVGSNEILLDDSQDFYNRILPLQPDAALHIYPSQTHVWLLTNIMQPDSQRALSEIKRFIDHKH